MRNAGQVESGVKWISISMAATRGTRLLATLILARMLAPEMFGIIGMAQISLDIFQRVREMGFGLAYIQRQEPDPAKERLAANTTFWLGCAINLGMFVLAFLFAPVVSAFFRSEGAQPVFQALCVGFLIDALITVPSMDLQKRLRFKQLAICEGIGAIAYLVIAVALAFSGWGVWSIVGGLLLSKVVFVLCLFRASPYRPRMEFSWELAGDLFKFGKYIWAFVLLSGIGDALDKLFVGRFYDEASLGLYTMAFLLATLPARNITQVVNKLTFPLFSGMQTKLDELRAALGKALTHTAMLSIPISFGTLAIAPLFVSVVMKEAWQPIIPLISVLCFFGLMLSVAAVAGPALKAIGKPKVLFYTSIVHHLLKLALLFALKDHGLLGICYAVLIPCMVSSLIAFVLIGRYLRMSIPDLVLPIFRPAVSAVVMYFAVRFVIDGLSATPIPDVLTLLVGIALGVAVYLGLSYWINRSVVFEARDALRRMLGMHRMPTTG